MTVDENHLEQLMQAIAAEVQSAINEDWKTLPRGAPEPQRAQALDRVSMKLEGLAAGFSLLAERCRDTASNLLESSAS